MAAAKKEVHYFDYDFYRGLDWYRSHFPLSSEQVEFARRHGSPFLTGEASPTYISHLWAPERVAAKLPDVKLLLVMRNPTDRAYSQYQMSRREGLEEFDSFERAFDAEEGRLEPELAKMRRDPRYNSYRFGAWSYLARSRYAEQVERWLGFFDRRRFLFLSAEDLLRDPQPVLDGVYEFLGLPGGHVLEDRTLLHTADYEPMSPDVRARLVDYFRPHNQRLAELTGIDFGWDR